MAESQAGAAHPRAARAAIFSLFFGALVLGLICYPYGILRDAGLAMIVAASVFSAKMAGAEPAS
jgi:hypothetical protein